MDAAAVVLDKNSAKPTCRVGITCAENIVTYLDDPMLVSNATGAPNAAPGADRLQLETALAVFGINDTLPSSYVELAGIVDGIVQTAVTRSQYNDIMDELARRTYQQSGDFITNGMSVKAIEHLDVGNNNGYLTANNGGDTPMASICVSPGEAYVKGYDVQYLVTQYTPVSKAVDYNSLSNVSIEGAYGNYVIVKEFVGSFDAVDGTRINLYDTAQQRITNNTYVGGGAAGSIIGTARVRDVYLASGSYGDKNATYYVYLYDIRMSTSALRNARSIGSSTGYADIVLETDGSAALYDSKFDTAVFPITSSGLRSLRDSNNAINNNYLFTKTFSVTIASGGTFSIATGAADETFPYSVGALTNLQEAVFKIVLNAAATVALTGTVGVTSGNTTVVGSGTSFTAQLRAEDKLTINGNTVRVANVANNTILTLAASPGFSAAANTFAKQYFSGDVVPWGAMVPPVPGARSRSIRRRRLRSRCLKRCRALPLRRWDASCKRPTRTRRTRRSCLRST